MVPVKSFLVLKFFVSIRNTSGYPFLSVEIFNSYVSDAAEARFRRILVFMMLLAFPPSIHLLMNGIDGVLIRACMPAVSHFELDIIFMVI